MISLSSSIQSLTKWNANYLYWKQLFIYLLKCAFICWYTIVNCYSVVFQHSKLNKWITTFCDPSLTFSEEFGTVVTQGEVMWPLCVPALARGRGSTALAVNTLGADLRRRDRRGTRYKLITARSWEGKKQWIHKLPRYSLVSPLNYLGVSKYRGPVWFVLRFRQNALLCTKCWAVIVSDSEDHVINVTIV